MWRRIEVVTLLVLLIAPKTHWCPVRESLPVPSEFNESPASRKALKRSLVFQTGPQQNKEAMTLVLSMNPFYDHDAEAPPPIYQPTWEPEHGASTHSTSEGSAHKLNDEPPCRRAINHMTMSRFTYFKRKCMEEEEIPLNLRSYCHTVPPVLEEQTHVLHLSLDKMRFIDDPEMFLRRSVLINNLLRRLRAEILLQGAWSFMPASAPFSLMMPGSALHQQTRKRLRLLRDEDDECVSACCCFFEASPYLPMCVYEREMQPSPSSSSSITERLEHLFDEEEEEDEDKEEVESEADEDLDSLCPGLDLCEASFRAREKQRTRDRLKEGETDETMDGMESRHQGAPAWSQPGRK